MQPNNVKLISEGLYYTALWYLFEGETKYTGFQPEQFEEAVKFYPEHRRAILALQELGVDPELLVDYVNVVYNEAYLATEKEAARLAQKLVAREADVKPPLRGWESTMETRRRFVREEPQPMQWGRRRQGNEEDYGDVGFTETGRWGNAGSGILFTTGEKILLLERSPYVEEPGTWGIPGGAIPQEEDGSFMDAQESAEKETEEELGFLPSYTLVDQYVFESGSFRYTTFIAKVSPDAVELDFYLNWENDAWHWFTPEELDDVNLHFGVVEVLNHKNPFK